MTESHAAPTKSEGALKRALTTVRKLRAELDESRGGGPVAIVGVGMRLPGGIVDLASLRRSLTDRRVHIRELPGDRRDRFPDQWESLPRRGGYLDEVFGFDPEFFGISPREARHMDPQHRLLLEVSWEALADAGVLPSALSDRTAGMYLGITGRDYADWGAEDADAYWATGNGNSFAAGRVSYSLGMTGPAIAVDTACSSSLVAMHQARRGLQDGDCDIALAGGVNLVLSPRTTELIVHTRSLAADGRCKPFDASADGFTRGEGCGVLVLKRAEDALLDGDRIHGTLSGSALNQDGRSTGFTAPNVRSQIDLITRALESAELTRDEITAVEAHGTGTALGDPIEIEALRIALGEGRTTAPVQVGAVKSALGHLEAAAGVAGVMRALATIRYRETYGVSGFSTLNPRIDLGDGLVIAEDTETLPANRDLHVGVSSFGMSGTNAHVIISGPPPAAGVPEDAGGGVEAVVATPVAFEVSAGSAEALLTYSERLAGVLDDLPEDDYAAFRYTVSHAREQLQHRAVVTADTVATAGESLRALAAGMEHQSVRLRVAGRADPVDPAVAVGQRRIVDVPLPAWNRKPYLPRSGAHDPRTGEKVAMTPATVPGTTAPTVINAAPAVIDPAGVPVLGTRALRWSALGPVGSTSPDMVLVDHLTDTGVLLAAGVKPVELGDAVDRIDWADVWRDVAGEVVLVMTDREDNDAPIDELVRAATGAIDMITHAVATAPAGIRLRVAVATDHDLPGPVACAIRGALPVLRLEAPATFLGITEFDASTVVADWLGLDLPGDEDHVRVRGGTHYGRRLSATDEPASEVIIRGDATYLVTGGAGGVGRLLVAELAARGARSIVVAGRRSEDRIAVTARTLFDDLRSNGVHLSYVEVDLGRDIDALTDTAAAAPHADLPVRGVLHAAGAIEKAMLAESDADGLSRMIAPKLGGAILLDRLAEEAGWPLDFFAVTSSLTAVCGTAGYSGYAAANGATEAVVAARRFAGAPGVVLCFGPWETDGMTDARDRSGFANHGLSAITGDDAGSALDLVAGTEPCVVAGPVDWDLFVPTMTAFAQRALYRDLIPEVETSTATGRVSPAVDMHDRVHRLVAGLLGYDDPAEVDTVTGFLDLGLDSLMAVDLARALSSELPVPVAVADVFGHPSIDDLAAALATRGPARTPETRETMPQVETGRLVPVRDNSHSETTAPAGALRHPENRERPESSNLPVPTGSAPQRRDDAIAIVGMAGRFPGADTVEEFWSNLAAGVDSVDTVPGDRWDAAEFRRPVEAGGITSDRIGALGDLRRFDADFFGIAAREAQNLDPAQRMLLESAWSAVEDAGADPRDRRGTRTGVYVGVSGSDYARILEDAAVTGPDAYYATGTALNAGAGRLAFQLGLRGPAITVDTACSSSLVAIHLATRALLSGEADAALAGGVNVIADPTSSQAVSRAHMLSPTGRCHSFSAAADGFVRAEGCGVLYLKRLDDAVADGDPIRAVIRGSAVNSDGVSAGLTAPNPTAQVEVIRAALDDAGCAPADIDYLEAHGTGTELGDPIEIQAAWEAYSVGRDPLRPLLVGSVKSNVGHAESAAGVVSVIKSVLAAEREMIPASLHCDELNPHIAWGDIGIDVVRANRRWARTESPRRWGISGFGFSGTNAHMVLEEGPRPRTIREDTGRVVIPVSAPTPGALELQCETWADRLTDRPVARMDRVAATIAGRAQHAHRLVVTADSSDSAVQALQAAARSAARTAPAVGRPRIGFVFSGQGSQYAGMGRELYETEPVFRDTFDDCARILRPELGASLVDLVLYPADPTALDHTRLTQPALVSLELALAELWRSWGVEAGLVMGHSVGEIAAAIYAGVMSREDGLRLIALRARLMDAAEGGLMVSLAADAETAAALADGLSLDMAALNGPRSVVLSGPDEACRELVLRADAAGVKARPLAVSHAFHSRMMDPVLEDLRQGVEAFGFEVPAVDLVSNVTGDIAEPDLITADYWARHVRGAVRFDDGAAAAAATGVDLYIEIGPDRTLVNLLCTSGHAEPERVCSSLRRGRGDRDSLLDAAGLLFAAGADVNWRRIYRGVNRVAVPPYVFSGERHWVPSVPGVVRSSPVRGHGGPHWGARLLSPSFGSEVEAYATRRTVHFPAYLGDHRLYGTVVTPAASHLTTVLSAVAGQGRRMQITDFICPRALTITEDEEYELQFALTGRGVRRNLMVASLLDADTDTWTDHIGGEVRLGADDPVDAIDVSADAGTRARAARYLTGEDFYSHFKGLGYDLGPSFRWISEAWIDGNSALIRFAQPDLPDDLADYEIYPGLIDSCFQCIAVYLVDDEVDEAASLAIPFAADRIDFAGRPEAGRELWGRVQVTEAGDLGNGRLRVDEADLCMYDSDGRVIMKVDRFRVRHAPRSVLEASLRTGGRSDTYRLSRAPAPAGADLLWPDGSGVELIGDDGSFRAALDESGLPEQTDARRVVLDVSDLVTGFPTGAAAVADRIAELVVRLAENADASSYTVALPDVPASLPLRRAVESLAAAAAVEDSNRRIVAATVPDEGAASTIDVLRSAPDEPRIEYADGWLVTRFESADGDETDLLSDTGPVLVTGGLGALGLAVTGMLVENGCTDITLVGRRVPGADALARIERWRGRGADVRTARCDLDDGLAVADLVARLFPDGVGTVFHLAGGTADGALDGMDRRAVDRVFAGKAIGFDSLATAIDANSPGDGDSVRLVVFSSISAALGSAGQANYAAANGYLDGRIEERRLAGARDASLAWGPWTTDEAGGMADTDVVGRAAARLGVTPFADADAREILGGAPVGGTGHLAAVRIDAGAFTAAVARRTGALVSGLVSAVEENPVGDVVGDRSGELRELEPDELRSALESIVFAAVGRAVGVTDLVAVDDAGTAGFEMLGVDSIMAIDIRRALSDVTGLPLPATVAIDYPSVDRMTGYLAGLINPADRGADSESDDRGHDDPDPRTADLGALDFDELVLAAQRDLGEEN